MLLKSQINLGFILYATATGIFKRLVPLAETDFMRDLTGFQINWRMHRVKNKTTKFSIHIFSALVILASWPPSPPFSSFFLAPRPSIESKKKRKAKHFWSYLRILSLLLQGTFLVYSFQIISFFLFKNGSKLFSNVRNRFISTWGKDFCILRTKKAIKKKQRYWTSVATFCFCFPCATVRPLSSPSFHPFYFKSKFVLCKKR